MGMKDTAILDLTGVDYLTQQKGNLPYSQTS